ncbi:hypothetical protein QUF80_15750 [Desulfococcaceae bacterium HSG8]|nr:hypothetical protein [Desulfococcaceae bacterium HSG8]
MQTKLRFALTILQRRLASSPEAIYQSLKRRHKKLLHMLEEVKINKLGLSVPAVTWLGFVNPSRAMWPKRRSWPF